MANYNQSEDQKLSEIVRIAREFEFTNQSIQFTAEAERRSHEQALIEAFQKHEEIRIAAEREGKRAVQDLANERQLVEYEQALRADQARREAAERVWQIEQQRKDALAEALAVEEAAERQRQANAIAQERLNTPRPPPPVPKAPPAEVPLPTAQEPPSQPAQVQQGDNAFAIQKSEHVTNTVQPAPKPLSNGFANAAPTSAFSNTTQTPRFPTSTYQGLPLPDTLPPELQQQYLQYIEILMQLKEHRRVFKDQILPDPRYRQAKAAVGDDRRFIRKSVSQLTEDRKKNREIMDAVMRKINGALQSPFPSVSLSRFIPDIQGSAPEVSSLYIYLINVFTKAIFAQYLVDASSDPKKADVIGMFASQILATAQLQWQNQISLWPLLVAKFARRCPVLFGVYGNDKTMEGKVLLGWGKEDGRFVTDQRHAERMTGLSSGWASITLRDYNKSKMENPAPSWYFWRSVALILNVPAKSVTATHYLVLKGLIEHNEQRILKLFGDYGRMILRQSVLDYPNNEYTGQNVSAQGLRLLRDIWDKDLHLRFV